MSYGSAPRRGRLKVGNCLILVAAIGAIGYIWWTRNHNPTSTDQSMRRSSQTETELPKTGDVVENKPAKPGDIVFMYGRSTKKWIEQAAEDFNKQNEGKWHIAPKAISGSRGAKQDILYGKEKPVIWSPADIYWTDKLNLDWRNPQVGKHNEDIIAETKPILKSLFVLLMWDDRAKLFDAAMQQPQYQGKTWTLLYDLSTKGWSAIGGSASWGKLKLAQTEATESNSGQAALVLMLLEYRRSHPGVSEADAGFLNFMRTIEGRVATFGDTTSKMVESFVAGGPQGSDMALCYESNAIQAIDKGATNLRVIYPDKTLATNYPAAILKADWVTSSQSEGARAFIDFLRTSDIQKRALDLGLRPAIDELRGAVDNALGTGSRATAGFKLDVPIEPERPVSTKVIDGLIYVWDRSFGTGKH
jgi:hypothetical protein